MAAPTAGKPDAAPPAGPRMRSPNYPALTLSESLIETEKIWKASKKYPMKPEVAVKYLGYNTVNGASLPVLSALRKYGLLVPVGESDEVRVSDDANTYFLYGPGSREGAALLPKFALRPPLFTEVLKAFPDGLPDDTHLRPRLMDKWKFATEAAAESFIRALRDAIKVAGVVVTVDPEAPAAENGVSDNAKEPPPMPTQPAITQPAAPIRPPPAPPSGAPGPGPTQARSWDLGDGAVLSLTVPQSLSRKNLEKLKRYVAALEMEAAIAWDE